MGTTLSIGERRVGAGEPCFVIAEIGSNHNRSFAIAKELVDEAKAAGADAVKFQSFSIEHWLSKDFTEFPTMQGVPDLHAALRQAELPYELYEEIAAYCAERDIACFSTPSHPRDVDRLFALGAPAFKFGSVQITDLPTIRRAAACGVPIILSGGASEMSEILQAVEAVLDTGNDRLALLHCTTLYPCEEYRLLNLRVLTALQALFSFPIGYSDHTTDPVIAPVAAVALGATVLEKHFTLDRKLPGPDHPFALEPAEFRRMVEAVRAAERALGRTHRRLLPEERDLARMGRRSLVATRTVEPGEIIRAEDVTTKRPGTGIEPRFLEVVVGRTARRRIEADRVITWDLV